MANNLSGNSWYIDTQYASAADDLVGSFLVSYITLTATAANARIVLSDTSAGTKLDLRVATSGDSQVFIFDQLPIRFPNGIRVTTLTNAVATAVGTKAQGA